MRREHGAARGQRRMRLLPQGSTLLGQVVALLAVAGCSPGLAKDLVLLERARGFTFTDPVHTAAGVLPPGGYVCQYSDASGYFCEAPATLNEDYLFSGGQSGGLHVSRDTPPIIHLFTQDKHPNTFYTTQLGMFTVGGSGSFKLGTEVSAPSFKQIIIEGD